MADVFRQIDRTDTLGLGRMPHFKCAVDELKSVRIIAITRNQRSRPLPFQTHPDEYNMDCGVKPTQRDIRHDNRREHNRQT